MPCKLKTESLLSQTPLALLSSYQTLNLILRPTPFCNPQPPAPAAGDGSELPLPLPLESGWTAEYERFGRAQGGTGCSWIGGGGGWCGRRGLTWKYHRGLRARRSHLIRLGGLTKLPGG
ncbi:hypothetical protein Cadr_000012264 [Camelus dromedarius]|uniref:Uncharacterized protein n=1 Tax=Camelus dromedarius TaxID=9838 RepID=A0A5N4DU84_CAMDR|nr:hypothetical protein Cadr_000012264 [Camelus dromedarius]